MIKTKEKLSAALSFVEEVVEGKLGLKLSKDETKLTNFKRVFWFLGYNFIGKYKGISVKSMDKLKDNIRKITKRTQGVNLKTVIGRLNPVKRGRVNYFQLGDVQIVYRKLDCWMRMRLRCIKFSRKWKTDNKRFPIRRFKRMGLLSFEQYFLNKCAKVKYDFNFSLPESNCAGSLTTRNSYGLKGYFMLSLLSGDDWGVGGTYTSLPATNQNILKNTMNTRKSIRFLYSVVLAVITPFTTSSAAKRFNVPCRL